MPQIKIDFSDNMFWDRIVLAESEIILNVTHSLFQIQKSYQIFYIFRIIYKDLDKTFETFRTPRYCI